MLGVLVAAVALAPHPAGQAQTTLIATKKIAQELQEDAAMASPGSGEAAQTEVSQVKVLLVLSDQGMGSASYMNNLVKPASPCVLGMGELFTLNSTWAVSERSDDYPWVSNIQSFPKAAFSANTGEKLNPNYSNDLLEAQLSKLMTKWWNATNVTAATVHAGLQKAYSEVTNKDVMLGFLKKVHAYAFSQMPAQVREQCDNRLVIATDLLPVMIGGSTYHNINSFEEFSLDNLHPTTQDAHALWTSYMKKIAQDPEVAALTLLRDETDRELSNMHAFMKPKPSTIHDLANMMDW